MQNLRDTTPGVCTTPTVVSRPPSPSRVAIHGHSADADADATIRRPLRQRSGPSPTTGTPPGLIAIATSHTVAPAGGTTCTRTNRPGGAVANGPGVCTTPTVVSRPPSPRASLSTGTPPARRRRRHDSSASAAAFGAIADHGHSARPHRRPSHARIVPRESPQGRTGAMRARDGRNLAISHVVAGEEPLATSHTVAPAGGTTCTRTNRPGGAVANGPGVCATPTVVSRPPSPRASLSTGTPPTPTPRFVGRCGSVRGHRRPRALRQASSP
jgi:hypothetical protein